MINSTASSDMSREFVYPASMARTCDSAPPLTYATIASDPVARNLIETFRTFDANRVINPEWTFSDIIRQTPLVAALAVYQSIAPYLV